MSLIKSGARTAREACKQCGATGPFYWAKDDTKLSGQRGEYVLVEKNDYTFDANKGDTLPDNYRHVCGVKQDDQTSESNISESANVSEETTVTESAPPATVAGVDPRMEQMFALIQQMFATPAIDRAQVETIAREVIAGVVFPTATVVVREGGAKKIDGLAHQSLARVVAAVSVGQDVMLVGPAGTGKTFIAQQVAEALELDYYLAPSLTSQTGEAKFSGFVDAAGTFHATAAYEWASNPKGGIYTLDELDNGNPNVNGWWNSVVANRVVRFPNGEVFKLTPQHRVIATANTYGFGRTREYVGRNPIDAATKNRFSVITVKIDDSLESALVRATGLNVDMVDRVLGYARKLRKASDSTGINVMCSPRNTVGMASLLTSDAYTWDMAVEDRMQDGISEESWRKLTAAM